MAPIPISIMIVVGLASAVNLPGSPFSVQFPIAAKCEFTLVKGRGKPIRMRSCRAMDDKSGHAYAAEYFDVSSGGATAQDVLLSAASRAASDAQSKLSSSNFHEVNGHTALDATLAPKAGGWITFVRYVLVDKSLVMLSVDGYRAPVRPQEVTQFFETLSVPAQQADTPDAIDEK
jgi:hypothetical protein